MSDPKYQRQFLEDLATQYKFYGDTRTAFLGRFAQENADKQNNQLRLTWTKDDLLNKEQKIQDELKKIYPALRENGCDIPETKQGRYKKGESPWELAYKWLWEVKFPEWKQKQPETDKPTEILKRCVLGLKGNYQQAQQKITEITQHLQTLLNDDTLSITVEEGSIIIIVESSQSDYDQIKKRLIGREIAGFPVEYVIDEWQDVCRRMLKSQTQLSSNSVLRRAYCNRNLIEEELFVDLALVQPKKDRNKAHKQDIEPHRGSEYYTRQEEAVEKRFAYPEFLKEVISKPTQKNIAIIGEPGAGKTTLLQKLAFWLLQETDDLVIWIPLRDLGEKRLGDYLQKIWLKDALRSAREEIKADWEQKFKDGKVWLLLDGLDEMGDTARNALSFQGWVTQAQLIISCRLNLWQANPVQLQGFQTYLTQPFQDEQMQQFIQKWFRVLSGEGQDVRLAESLWSALQTTGKERIQDLCRNPLRLTLLCSIWQGRKGDLPDTTAKLYQKFVDYIYEWKKKEFPVTDEERQRLNSGLGELAKASLEREVTRFRLTHRFACKYLGKPDNNSLLDTALRLGWLNEVGVDADEPEDPVYAFYHATFQEYFAALAVDDWDYFLPRNHVNFLVEGKKYRIFEVQWKQVILLWLGRGDVADEEKEKFIQTLVEFEDGCGEWNFDKVDKGFYEYRTYFIVATVVADFKQCTLFKEIIDKIVQYSFGSFNEQKKDREKYLSPIFSASRNVLLAEIDKKSAIAVLEQMLDRSDIDVRLQWLASDALREIAPSNNQVILFSKKLLSSLDSNTLVSLILEEAESVNDQTISTLLSQLTNPDFHTWREVTSSLMQVALGNNQLISALEQLRNDANVLDTVFEVAKKILPEHYQVIQALFGVIKNTENEDNDGVSTESLEKLTLANNQEDVELVQVLKTTEDKYSRKEAAESLKEILTTSEQYAGVVLALKDCLSDEVYQNNFDRFNQCYKVLWDCAANLPYPEFYQAWHHPPTTPHPEVAEHTPVGHNSTIASLETQQIDLFGQLQNLPIFCLKAHILATETRESEIAKTLCRLIWKQALPNQRYPQPTTPADLCYELDELKLTLNLSKLAILLTECETPTPELIAFCHKLTDTVDIAWLTDEPLEAPLKGFPPHQSNLLSAIQTWLEET
ncbi:NACHT domain-containing protein [Argonema antarcticum]|uniref:NACHT domain-containing protein n=1 Tax=Argonema antarcticum TaxID=2942763 RepID=UPI0020121806|nr:NACHT domain-containing protein [Argonema antarcticum]MCL1469893.1 NACHT domain-containing protein [Argonema antarcticum A004/B2]